MAGLVGNVLEWYDFGLYGLLAPVLAARFFPGGDRIAAQTIDGRLLAYRVSAARIVRADASGLDPADPGPGGARLALVTCYPFTGVLHSPWRYVVIADRDSAF